MRSPIALQMDEVLKEISSRMVTRYSDRYKKLGYDVKTLGWGSRDQQLARFAQVLKLGVSLNGKRILDIGCGFGDLAEFLLKNRVTFSEYVGWDLNPDLVDEARGLWKTIRHISFDVKNVADADCQAVADVGIMLGVLNLNLKGQIDNYDYASTLIRNAFNSVNECLVVDFLSAKLTGSYPAEDFVFYYEPARILDLAFSLTDNIVLHHNYAAIPQKEFMVTIYR